MDVNVDEMPAGREMDALVAEKVMGQIDFNHVGFFWTEGTTKDGKDGWDGFACPRCNSLREDNLEKCCEYYSTDIAAAWQVVDEFCYMFGAAIIITANQYAGWTVKINGREGISNTDTSCYLPRRTQGSK
jgi:RNA polymerase subunit RPABC4/transcription elongation factor Spt4